MPRCLSETEMQMTPQTLKRTGVFVALIAISLCPRVATAQNTADMVGTVTDTTDAVVAGAKVTIKNLGTNVSRSMVTSGAGEYSFTLLPVGTYSVSVEA